MAEVADAKPEVGTAPGAVGAARPVAVGRREEVDSPWRQARRRFVKNRLAVAGLVVLAMLYIVAALAPVIAPYKPYDIDLFNLKAPPSREHLLGTDELGRDVLTRLLYGARISLTVGLGAEAVAMVIGVTLGSVAAFYGGLVDNLIMRFVDVMLSFPTLFLLIILAAFFKTTVFGIILIVAMGEWETLARLVRGSVLSLKEQEFCEAARALGCPDHRIILRHLLPNAAAPLIVAGTLGIGIAILVESALSFLGVGIQPPVASWGNMLTNAQDYVFNAPWLAVWPGFMIFITVLCFNFVGDGLRDALDPKLKGKL